MARKNVTAGPAPEPRVTAATVAARAKLSIYRDRLAPGLYEGLVRAVADATRKGIDPMTIPFLGQLLGDEGCDVG